MTFSEHDPGLLILAQGKAARDLQADHSFAGQIEYAMECLLGTRVDRWAPCSLDDAREPV